MRSDRGQVLPLFALMLAVLVGMMALAIDVTSAYASRRVYRTTADAAALAGAQDLQIPGTRSVTAAEYARARADAVSSVEGQFSATATCTTNARNANRRDCSLAGLPYAFSVVTPIWPRPDVSGATGPACATCDPNRSVQVNFANPVFPLTFSRLFGQATWNVGISSVAGLMFNKAYTIVTLRPPTSPAIPGVRDMAINGGTKVVVVTGDVGTNANMLYSGTNSELILDSGFNMYYYDPFNGPLWGTSPAGMKIFSLIGDPLYPVPSRAGGPAGAIDTTGCATRADDVVANPRYAPSVPTTSPGVPDMTKITCYEPGIYGSQVTVANGSLGIFEPGLYFFDGGLNAQGSVIGGYTPSSEGVAFVFPESSGTMFKNRTSGGSSSLTQIVALNAGSRYLNPGGREATPAHDYAGGFVQTNTTPALIMSVIVPADPRCPVAYPLPATCSNTVENVNKSIDLSGGSGVYLAGVQYAPSDNVTIAGNTSTGGYVGQVWAWTLVYTGGSQINQEGSQGGGPGILRLDAACTAIGTPCVP